MTREMAGGRCEENIGKINIGAKRRSISLITEGIYEEYPAVKNIAA